MWMMFLAAECNHLENLQGKIHVNICNLYIYTYVQNYIFKIMYDIYIYIYIDHMYIVMYIDNIYM